MNKIPRGFSYNQQSENSALGDLIPTTPRAIIAEIRQLSRNLGTTHRRRCFRLLDALDAFLVAPPTAAANSSLSTPRQCFTGASFDYKIQSNLLLRPPTQHQQHSAHAAALASQADKRIARAMAVLPLRYNGESSVNSIIAVGTSARVYNDPVELCPGEASLLMGWESSPRSKNASEEGSLDLSHLSIASPDDDRALAEVRGQVSPSVDASVSSGDSSIDLDLVSMATPEGRRALAEMRGQLSLGMNASMSSGDGSIDLDLISMATPEGRRALAQLRGDVLRRKDANEASGDSSLDLDVSPMTTPGGRIALETLRGKVSSGVDASVLSGDGSIDLDLVSMATPEGRRALAELRGEVVRRADVNESSGESSLDLDLFSMATPDGRIALAEFRGELLPEDWMDANVSSGSDSLNNSFACPRIFGFTQEGKCAPSTVCGRPWLKELENMVSGVDARHVVDPFAALDK
ncbi:hypothetical protein MVEN_01135500 [Mycena venus]|uniref:Uncharacterized protein n=1 Tax=Mycena venus TaxID=2733690 RepID=A0A8H7D0R5_9AGAR|nr:hypothetical protein MVEN_01135500 [Mycena venus]